jgi:hypothetical protein
MLARINIWAGLAAKAIVSNNTYSANGPTEIRRTKGPPSHTWWGNILLFDESVSVSSCSGI